VAIRHEHQQLKCVPRFVEEVERISRDQFLMNFWSSSILALFAYGVCPGGLNVLILRGGFDCSGGEWFGTECRRGRQVEALEINVERFNRKKELL